MSGLLQGEPSPSRYAGIQMHRRMTKTYDYPTAGCDDSTENGSSRRRSTMGAPRHMITTIKCGPHDYRVGLYGWRRRCLYGLVLLLLVVVVINLALTLFILRVIDFSPNGMGGLQIINDGVIANGNVYVMDTLIAAKISSRAHVPIRVYASHNLTLEALDESGKMGSKLFLDRKAMDCTSDLFQVRDKSGKLVFSASKDEVLVGAKHLTISGEGGSSFSGSVQTSHVTAPVGKALLLESATRNLELMAPQGIALESRAGTITTNSLHDLTLQSTAGMIKFDSPNIFFRRMPTSTIQTSSASRDRPEVYQVCVCSGGKLFLASSRGVCAADHDFCK